MIILVGVIIIAAFQTTTTKEDNCLNLVRENRDLKISEFDLLMKIGKAESEIKHLKKQLKLIDKIK